MVVYLCEILMTSIAFNGIFWVLWTPNEAFVSYKGTTREMYKAQFHQVKWNTWFSMRTCLTGIKLIKHHARLKLQSVSFHLKHGHPVGRRQYVSLVEPNEKWIARADRHCIKSFTAHHTPCDWQHEARNTVAAQKYWLHERNMIIIFISKAHASVAHAIISFWPNGCARSKCG
jgi:hypothetical protein